MHFPIIFFYWYVANQETNKTVPAIFFLSKYFLNNLPLTVSMQNTLSKLSRFCNKKWITLGFLQQSTKNVCVKFIDRLSRFSTVAQMFTTQKPFLTEIPSPWKLQHQSLFKNTFFNQITICQIPFEIFDVTQIYTQSKYLSVFSFFISFFCWTKKKQSSIKENTRKTENCQTVHILE